jgi:hypothetical protein
MRKFFTAMFSGLIVFALLYVLRTTREATKIDGKLSVVATFTPALQERSDKLG